MIPSSLWKERGEKLRAYIDAAQGKPAHFDGCSTWPAHWIADMRGIEFDWPVFDTEDEMHAHVEKVGGLVNVWGSVAREIGLEEVDIDSPVIGDVGVIHLSETRQVGGIFAWGGAIFIRSISGVGSIGVVGRKAPFRIGDRQEIRPVVAKVWRVPYE